ncbi:MAG: YncE family protein [Pseudomonadota bacterium]|nr:YncE family protein [Pseudomonadota bacterium]
MTQRKGWIEALTLCGAVAALSAFVAPAKPAFEKTGTIAAPDDRWDFASWDAHHRLLLVAHGKDVLIIDPAHPQAVRAVGALQGAHGVVAIPGTDNLLVTSAKDNTARVIDEASGTEIASIPVAEDPDAVVLSASGLRAYVMAARAGVISVIDLVKNVEVRRIAVKPGLEVPVLVTPGLIAVNDEDASEIEMVNLIARKMVGSIPLTGCQGPTGLAYDPSTGLALSACGNGQAALVDLKARRVVTLLAIGAGPDTVIWDSAHKRFLVPCGKSGTLSVIRLVGRTPIVEPPAQTEPSARTAAYDPATGHIYLPAASFGPAEGLKRGPLVPGSFHIVVMSPHVRS